MSRRALLAVALLALAARVSWEVALHRDRAAGGPVGTLAGHLLGDERAYDGFARQVAAGTLERERAFYQEPLYAWVLGQLYRVVPPPAIAPGTFAIPHAAVHTGVIIVQHALGVLMAVLVAALGWRCLGAGVGWLAGIFAALSGPAIFAESMLLKESVALALWVAALHLWLDVLQDRGGRLRAAGLGLALGVLILLRGNTYLLLGLVLLTLVVRWRGRRRAGAAAAVLAAALVAVSPATLHNLRRGDAVLTTYQAGSNAAIGQPDSDVGWRGVTYEPIHAGRGDAAYEEQDAVAVAEAGAGRRLTGREVSAWWWRETARRVSIHPAAAAERLGRKLLLTFHGDEVPDVKDWNFFRLAVPWLSSPLSDLTWLGPLALLALVLLPWREQRPDAGGAGPRRRGAWRADLLVVRGSVAVIMASFALFYVMGRYRLPAAPGLWILSAGLIVAAWRSARRLRSLLTTVVPAIAVVALGRIPLRPDVGGLQLSWANLASVELARARAAGTGDEARQHRDAAVAAAQRALEIAPGFPEARSQLIFALDCDAGGTPPRRAEALDQAWRLLLVMEAERTGRSVQPLLGRDLLEVQDAALRLRVLPTVPGRDLYVCSELALACRRIAQDLREPKELPFALDLVDEALRLQPDDRDGLVQRGLVLKRMGRLDDAEAAYRLALQRGADTVELHNNLGNLLLATDRADEATAHFERALQLQPENATALENLERARAASGR